MPSSLAPFWPMMHYRFWKEELECASPWPGCSVTLLTSWPQVNVSGFVWDFSGFKSPKPSMLEKHPLAGPGQALMTTQSISTLQSRDKPAETLHLTFCSWSLFSWDSEVGEIQGLNGLLSNLDSRAFQFKKKKKVGLKSPPWNAES